MISRWVFLLAITALVVIGFVVIVGAINLAVDAPNFRFNAFNPLSGKVTIEK